MKNEKNEKNERTDNDVLHAMYTKDTFVKVKQKLEIGKILFSFVNSSKKTANGSVENIDCYLDAVEFGAILMSDIRSGHLYKALADSKARAQEENKRYPEVVFTSPYGGCSLDANGKTTRDNSKKVRAVSRFFTIAPGSRADIIITAYQYPANITSTGAYVRQESSKPEITVMVSASYNDLRKLQYKWSWLEKDYMARTFSVDNMRSTYVPHTVPAQEEYMPEAYNTVNAPAQPDTAPRYTPVNNTPNTAVSQPVQQPTQPVQPAARQIIDTDEGEFIKCKITGPLVDYPNNFKAAQINDESDRTIGKLWFPKDRYDSTKTQGIFKIFAQRKNNDYLLVSYV